MVKRDYIYMLSDEEAARLYKFRFCENCPFYECELIREYELFSEKHPYPIEHEQIIEHEPGRLIIRAKFTPIDSNGEIMEDYARDIHRQELYKQNLDEHTAIVDNFGCKLSLSYNQKEFENGCIMSCRHVYQVECGRKTVTEGIGDHYKIEIIEKVKENYLGSEKIIKENTEDRWEPLQPVFISAQTGQGKNYFIENTLIPYVRELNHREKTSYKILILSNRLALKQQIKNKLDGNDDLKDEEGQIYSYGEYADVMTYQSLLRKEKNLEKRQKIADSKYIYVICDEAHFFASDAMFNPHTHKILQAIVRLFQDAVRVYMSATPYECLEYIIKCEDEERERLNVKKYNYDQSEWKYGKMTFYHFKRDYSYLDVKTYSSINELYDEIVESVVRRKEKWLIFIDDKEKCVKEKVQLEKLIKDKESKKKDGEDTRTDKDNEAEKKDGEDAETDKDNETKKKVERVYSVDANSKKEPIYQEIVKNEKLNKDTYVLISTSVLDNGVNLTDIKNIVVSDMDKSKCLQMVGRARVSEDGEHKTLYVKRFCTDDADKKVKSLMRQQDAYHSYGLAYDELGNAQHIENYDGYKFLNKYYDGKEEDWRDAKHWFGRPFINATTKLYLNEIAKSLVEKLIPKYQYILDEMEEEKNEQQSQESGKRIGQKYLEYQLSWFGKKYCEDDDITFVDKEKAKKEFIAFLKEHAEKGTEIVSEEERNEFSKKFIELFEAIYGKSDGNGRQYGAQKMNKLLKNKNIEYKIQGKLQVGPWKIVRDNRQLEYSQSL